ncbi:MAG TPA: CbiX/SirB N-terminal domain-containing protein [Nitrososphaeraceae archaeon]|nr:CbiX/SirB N-terminal domain-containing protein [Nitrososphaeraceae archaeon]
MTKLTKKALLIVDRGSREPDVRLELQNICSIAKHKVGYDYTGYCFLEVVQPFIKEGIENCLANGADLITVMPYFLYPGMKLKDTVRQSASIGQKMNLKMIITKPLSYHSILTDVVINRIQQLKTEQKIQYSDLACDILLIGHGSSDKNARNAFIYTVNALKPFYRNVNFCFLELDKPDIEEGIKNVIFQNDPKIILLMPYFLHKGAHIKRDIITNINAALEKYRFQKVFMTKHLGVDEKLVDLIVERVKEVEEKRIDLL